MKDEFKKKLAEKLKIAKQKIIEAMLLTSSL